MLSAINLLYMKCCDEMDPCLRRDDWCVLDGSINEIIILIYAHKCHPNLRVVDWF